MAEPEVLWLSTHATFKDNQSDAQKAKIVGLLENIAQECGGREVGIIKSCVFNNADMGGDVDFIHMTAFTNPSTWLFVTQLQVWQSITEKLKRCAFLSSTLFRGSLDIRA